MIINLVNKLCNRQENALGARLSSPTFSRVINALNYFEHTYIYIYTYNLTTVKTTFLSLFLT